MAQNKLIATMIVVNIGYIKIILSLLPHNKNGEQNIQDDELLEDYKNKYIINRRRLTKCLSDVKSNSKQCYYCQQQCFFETV